MSLSIHRRTGHGRALLLSAVCAERNQKEFRINYNSILSIQICWFAQKLFLHFAQTRIMTPNYIHSSTDFHQILQSL